MRRALTNAFASCSFRAAAAETPNPVFLQGGDLVRVRSKNAARQTLQNTIVRDDAPTMRSMSRAYCTRHNDDTEEGFATKTWEHARRSAREGWQSARDSNESDADEDDGIKREFDASTKGDIASRFRWRRVDARERRFCRKVRCKKRWRKRARHVMDD